MTPQPIHCVLVPLVFAAVAFTIRSDRLRPGLLPIAGIVQIALIALLLPHRAELGLSGWIRFDALAQLVVLTVALLFLFCALYAPAYLRLRSDRPNRVFCSGLLVLVAMLSLVAMAHHLGLMWIGIETTALASAPLLYFNQTPKSLEAAWKYLLIGSVGIALALLGSFFLAYAALKGGQTPSLLLDDLTSSASSLSKPWLHAAFATLLVGFGTKMGLAPMHTWKPDAYGEAPGILGALLAGGVTTGAFVAILRVLSIMHAAGEGAFAQSILVAMGLLSMVFAAVFVVRQKDFKRMLAYSSVEHMGILVLGAGIGGLGMYGALLHMLNNAMTKGVLFLSSGNIHRAFGSKNLDQVSGALNVVPASSALFLIGFLAITGSPPFGPFISEFAVLRAAIGQERFFVAAAFLLLLLAVFVGMGTTVLPVVFGARSAESASEPRHRETPGLVLPIVALALVVLGLGVYLPDSLRTLIEAAARAVEVRP